MKQMTRRQLLRLFGVGAAAALSAGCQPKVVEKIVKETVEVEKIVEQTVVVKEAVEVEKEVTRVVREAPVAATAEPVTLRYFHKGSETPEHIGGGTKQLLALFTEAHPNITVEFSATGGDFFDKLLAMFAANDPPEIFTSGDVNFNKDRELSLVQYTRLDDYLDRDAAEYDMADLYPTITDAMKMFDGHYYFVPKYVNSNVMAYNLDLFDEAKIPYPTADWTWDDIVMAGKEIVKRDKDGTIVQYGKSSTFGWWGEYYYYQRQAGLDNWLSEDGQQVFMDEQSAIDGLQFYYDCAAKHEIADRPGESLEGGFKSGRYGMWNFVHTSQWGGVTAAGLTWDIAIPPMGIRHDGGEFAISGTVVAKGIKYTEEAWTFAKWETGFEGGKQWVRMGLAPNRKSVTQATWAQKKDMPEYPLNPMIYFEAMPYNMIVHAPPGSWDANYAQQRRIDLMWDGKLTPEEVCKQTAEEMRELIASA